MKVKCEWCGDETGDFFELIEYTSGFRKEKHAFMCVSCYLYGKKIRIV
jgi:hypothetical protein